MAALALFNDVIITEASSAGFDVLDIRRLFASDEDYANPIEPSVVGGAKLAATIAGIVDESREGAVRIWA